MRKLLFVLLAIVVIVAAAVIYLVATTPKSAAPLRFPLSGAQRQFVSHVPATADAFAYVPAAAVVHAKLQANPVTREPLAEWTAQEPLPKPWMLGDADLLVWRSGKSTSYAIEFDAVRATLIRIWTTVAGPADTSWEGRIMIIGERTTPSGAIDLSLADALPEGDALIVQRDASRGAFPPIARPAYSSLKISAEELLIVSRAEADDSGTPEPIRAAFPKGALFSISFGEPPRLLGDFSRILGTDIRELVGSGGSIALYDVDAGLLLPRPRGVIAVRASDAGRAAVAQHRRTIEIVGETGEADGKLLVSFDRKSLSLYLKDEMVPATFPATRWVARVDPARLVPVLRRVGDNAGLRIAAPRIHRAARDLRRWIGPLENAESIEAAEWVSDGVAELRVRIVSK